MNTTVSTPRRWRTAVIDSLGLIGVVWAIPLAILVVGAPIVLAVVVLKTIASWLP
jgi:hypothetical protein